MSAPNRQLTGSERTDRAERLAGRVAEEGLDALLVSDLHDVRWLTGFTGTNAVAVVGPELRLFITDFRYVEQAESQVEGFELTRGKQDLLGDASERLSGRVGFDDGHLTVRSHRRLEKLVPDGVELAPAEGLIGQLRAVKDAGELASIAQAAHLADQALEAVLEGGLAGRGERELAVAIERAMQDRGAEGPSFPAIVASGAHGALPHAEPRDEPIEAGSLVIVDFGARVDGLCSDCTRTLAAGEPGEEAREVYELVLRAQKAALDAVRAGAGCRAVDAVAREIIQEGGHGEHFGHGLGHGVGLEVHEAPRLSPAGEGELVEGNVVTVEPGVYLPGRLGVRIEDLVVVGAEGPEVLSGHTKELWVIDQ